MQTQLLYIATLPPIFNRALMREDVFNPMDVYRLQRRLEAVNGLLRLFSSSVQVRVRVLVRGPRTITHNSRDSLVRTTTQRDNSLESCQLMPDTTLGH